MEHSDLKLQVGESLYLQPHDGETGRRLQVRVIGYLPGRSLIVTTPRIKDKVMIMREGQPFVVRVLVANRVLGFTTKVLRSCASPYPYLHLSYPQEMEQIIVRQAQRVKVKLFASLTNSNPDFQFEKPHPATVVDISTSGAMLVSSEQLGEEGDDVTLACVFKIAGAEKLLSIPAILRNVRSEETSEQPKFHHGVEFTLKEQQDIFTLHGYVYEQIVKSQTE
ncbi:flagellar brake protein [Thiogranum longum]|jgi:c-di-GMP-binding flagellar brake protein YcgR